MRKLICILLTALFVLVTQLSLSEGLLPSLTETVGIAMPSFGEALLRYPDSEIENDDGSVTELYFYVSETDFNIFSVYLEDHGAELADYHIEGGVLTAEIWTKDASFNLNYDSKNGKVEVVYPIGTFDEQLKLAKLHFSAMTEFLSNGQYKDAIIEMHAIPLYSIYNPLNELLKQDKRFLTEASIAMPSLCEVLHCYPNTVVENEDGSVTEQYTNISETGINSFISFAEMNGSTVTDNSKIKNIIIANIQTEGVSIQLNYDKKSKEAMVNYPIGTHDEQVKIAQLQLQLVNELLIEKKYKEAVEQLVQIPDYKEYRLVKDLLNKDKKLDKEYKAYIKKKLAPYKKKGNTVTFGTYEQDYDRTNGPEPIEWIVLDVKEGKTLLLSKYVLAWKPFNTKNVSVTWEHCTLRTWLNNDFLDSAFSEQEKLAIMKTKVDNSEAQNSKIWWSPMGNDTNDQIFLLSYHEAFKQYFSSNYARKCSDEYGTDEWWLRTPTGSEHFGSACIVCFDGTDADTAVDNGDIGVRPAFWLNLESSIF